MASATLMKKSVLFAVDEEIRSLCGRSFYRDIELVQQIALIGMKRQSVNSVYHRRKIFTPFILQGITGKPAQYPRLG